MRALLLFVLSTLACTMAFAANSQPPAVPSNATVFDNLDDSTLRESGGRGWGWCSACAGGANTTTDLWMEQNQTTPPPTDGASTEFHVGGQQFTNALFYDKLGANNALKNFQFDFL